MKKIIACISLVFAMSAGVTAMAATTAEPSGNSSNNGVSVTPDATYKTVLITKKDSSDIVYVDQNDSGYTASSAANFLLKADAGYGDYTLKMGGSDSDSVTTEFSITPDESNVGTKADAIKLDSDNDTSTQGFKFENADLGTYKYLQFTATKDGKTKSVTTEMGTTVTGEASANLAVKVTDVPDGVTLTVSLVK